MVQRQCACFKLVLSIILLLLIAGCTSKANNGHHYGGEHLITPFFADVKGWEVQEHRGDNFSGRIWFQPKTRILSTYSVTLYYNDVSSLEAKRELVDRPGLEGCDVFNSASLSKPRTEYLVEYWETSCDNANGTRAKILHLLLRGKNDIYHLQKSWQGDVNQSDLNHWTVRFETAYICDNDNGSAQCPEIKL